MGVTWGIEVASPPVRTSSHKALSAYAQQLLWPPMAPRRRRPRTCTLQPNEHSSVQVRLDTKPSTRTPTPAPQVLSPPSRSPLVVSPPRCRTLGHTVAQFMMVLQRYSL